MILLPSGPKILLPQKREAWSSSLSLPKDQFGHDVVRARFLLKGRTSDGFIKKFWFEDRDDADAFLHAIVTETINQQPALWRLPVPNWHPDIGEGLVYEFATVTFLTATTTSNYTRPGDWDNSANSIEAIGAGGSGGVGNRSTSSIVNATGGAGGAFGKSSNLTIGSSVSYICGTPGASVNRTTAGATNGNAGTDTLWDGASYAAAVVAAQGGPGGTAANSNTFQPGATGGTGKGTVNFNGGSSGSAGMSSSTKGATGGGGAAGPNGAGGSSTGVSGGTGTGTNGGNGDNGSGGTGGTGNAASAGTAGSDGTEYGSSGSGGGGGAGGGTTGATNSGAGGNYGGGSGGLAVGSTTTASNNATVPAGKQGLIVVTYTPLVVRSGYNLAMIGM